MALLSVAHLRPLTMGQIIDRSIRLYRRNFLKFLGVAALVQIPNTLVALIPAGLGLTRATTDPAAIDPTGALAVGLLTFVIAIVSGIWTQVGAAALTQMATDSYLGQSTSIFDAFRKIGRSWLSLLGALLWLGFLGLVMVIVFIIPCVGWIAAIPGGGIFIYGVLILMPLLAPIVVLERRSARKALRRAWDLARERFWWMFGFFLLLGLFSIVVVQGPFYVLLGATTAIGDSMLNPTVLSMVQIVIGALLGVVYFPIQISCVLLAYFDTRIRQEGLDLALQVADDETLDVATLLQQVPSAPEQRLITGAEWGYFVGIAIGFAIIIVGVSALIGAALFPVLSGLQ